MKQYQTKHLLFILPVILIAGTYITFEVLMNIPATHSVTGPNVRIGNTVVGVMIADEPSEQWQGLSDRQFMGAMNGMLFVFPNYQRRNFVMRRMHYPLDIVWIASNTVVQIDKRLEPQDTKNLTRYSANEPVNYVLEVHGGLSDAFDIKVGDKVEINID